MAITAALKHAQPSRLSASGLLAIAQQVADAAAGFTFLVRMLVDITSRRLGMSVMMPIALAFHGVANTNEFRPRVRWIRAADR